MAGPEVQLYLSSSAQSLLSINLKGVAESVDSGIIWEEVGFVHFPIETKEPKVIVDTYKHFQIDHTKKGKLPPKPADRFDVIDTERTFGDRMDAIEVDDDGR